MQRENNFHLIEPSPWPFLSAFSAFGLLFFFALSLHFSLVFITGLGVFLLALLGVAAFWWRSVIKEALFDGAHNETVRKGLSIGMIIFIVSEVMFFFAFFWSFFKGWLDPVKIIENFLVIKTLGWPPEGIKTLDPWNIPLLNTLILLLSGTSVTWAHYSLLNGDNKSMSKALLVTVLLGLTFTALQAYEYYHAAFDFKEDGMKAIYSSNFYMATGFHGVHVIIGTIFLMVCLVRSFRNRYTVANHVGFQCAAWYWNFVDVVWLLLFIFLYVLSS